MFFILLSILMSLGRLLHLQITNYATSLFVTQHGFKSRAKTNRRNHGCRWNMMLAVFETVVDVTRRNCTVAVWRPTHTAAIDKVMFTFFSPNETWRKKLILLRFHLEMFQYTAFPRKSLFSFLPTRVSSYQKWRFSLGLHSNWLQAVMTRENSALTVFS